MARPSVLFVLLARGPGDLLNQPEAPPEGDGALAFSVSAPFPALRVLLPNRHDVIALHEAVVSDFLRILTLLTLCRRVVCTWLGGSVARPDDLSDLRVSGQCHASYPPEAPPEGDDERETSVA